MSVDYNPLVSCHVLTYNSAKFVIDALDSIKKQTYDNLEIIVSDDCSQDETVAIVQEWIRCNKSRFVNAILITSPVNTGTNANCNRCLRRSSGEWIKILAGDDALCSDCIESFIDYVKEHPSHKWIASPVKQYLNSFEDANVIDFNAYVWNNSERYNLTAEQQLKYMVRSNFISAPSCFINAEIINNVGGFEEKYGILEDHPLYIKLLEHDYKCYMMNKNVVKQRISDENVCSSLTDRIFNWRLRQMDYLVSKDMCFKYMHWREVVRYTNRHIVDYLFHNLKLNSKKYQRLYYRSNRLLNLWTSDKIWGKLEIQ